MTATVKTWETPPTSPITSKIIKYVLVYVTFSFPDLMVKVMSVGLQTLQSITNFFCRCDKPQTVYTDTNQLRQYNKLAVRHVCSNIVLLLINSHALVDLK